MKVFIVQFRRSGEDYEVRAFRNKAHAEAFAIEFLQGFVWEPERYETLLDLEVICADKELAYINITWDVI